MQEPLHHPSAPGTAPSGFEPGGAVSGRGCRESHHEFFQQLLQGAFGLVLIPLPVVFVTSLPSQVSPSGTVHSDLSRYFVMCTYYSPEKGEKVGIGIQHSGQQASITDKKKTPTHHSTHFYMFWVPLGIDLTRISHSNTDFNQNPNCTSCFPDLFKAVCYRCRITQSQRDTKRNWVQRHVCQTIQDLLVIIQECQCPMLLIVPIQFTSGVGFQVIPKKQYISYAPE